VEAQDQTTHTHLHRVRTYATEIGKHLKLSDDELQALQAAAILHDVGKLAVPEHIVSKPGKLSADEFEKLKLHTVVGGEIVEQMGFPFPVAPVVRGHHEKWDGSGYPDGLSGTQIPLGARILSAVDCFDALVTDRQYRRAMSPDKAMEIIVRDSGKAFDPNVVEVFRLRYRELEILVRNSLTPSTTLSGDLRVLRGTGPDAGLEVSDPAGRPAPGNEASLEALVTTRSSINGLVETAKRIPAGGRGHYLAEPLSLLVQRMIPHDALTIFVRTGHILRAQGVSGIDGGLLATLETPVGKGLAGWVADNSKSLLNGDPAVESGAEFWRGQSQLRATLAAPLASPNGVVGVLCLYRRQKDSFSKSELKLLEQAILRLHEPFSRPESPGAFDIAANGHGRRFFAPLNYASLSEAVQRDSVVLIRIDLDRIPAKPEIAGLEPPDLLIASCCEAIRASFPGDVTLAQIADTEFAVLTCVEALSELDRKLNDLRASLARLADRPLKSDRFQAAIGWAQAEIGLSVADLLAAAERALIEDRHRRASGDLRQLDRAVRVDESSLPLSRF
jgi:putative nucleotidyltransferase with HDIG domain